MTVRDKTGTAGRGTPRVPPVPPLPPPLPPVDGAESAFWLIADTIVKTTAGVRLVDIVTTGMPDGTPAWVRSVEDLFILNRTSTLTPDNITIADALVGGGQWIRKELPSLVWQEQAAWFVDPISGNDENPGFTGPSALKTDAERLRRWGRAAFSPVNAITTTYTSAPASTDIVIVKIGPTTVPVTFQGTPVAARPASTLTAGTTGLVDGTSLPVLEDTSIADWTADVGKRIRLITKAATSFVGQDTGGGLQQAISGAFGAPTYSGANPANADDYVVEDLTAIMVGDLECNTPLALGFVDLDISNAGLSNVRGAVFEACRFPAMSMLCNGVVEFLGCGGPGAQIGSSVGFALFVTCTFNKFLVDTGLVEFSDVCAAIHSADSGLVVANGTALFMAGSHSACACVNNTFDGLAVGSLPGGVSPLSLIPSAAVVGALVWGTGNGNYGVRVGSGSLVSYGDGTGGAIGGFLTVTGTTNDSLVGGTPKAYAALPFFQGTNGAGIVAAT